MSSVGRTRGELNELRRKIRKLVKAGRIAPEFLKTERDHYELTWRHGRFMSHNPSGVVLGLEQAMRDEIERVREPGEIL